LRRQEWHELPEAVRLVVIEQCGDVAKVEPPHAGRNSPFVATLHLARGGRVFCKGVPTADARTHRREAAVNPLLPPTAPRLLWEIETAGWLLLGFEHVEGRHAHLEPDSPDLPLVAATLSEMSRTLTPCRPPGVPAYSAKILAARGWRRLLDDPPPSLPPWTRENLSDFADIEATATESLAGDSLQHTDLHEQNILVGTTAHVIDWAWVHTAPPWADTAFLVIRLIQAGHDPLHAEQWAQTIDAWRAAPADSVTAFAVAVYGLWEHLRHAHPLPIRQAPTRAAQRWAQWRTGND